MLFLLEYNAIYLTINIFGMAIFTYLYANIIVSHCNVKSTASLFGTSIHFPVHVQCVHIL